MIIRPRMELVELLALFPDPFARWAFIGGSIPPLTVTDALSQTGNEIRTEFVASLLAAAIRNETLTFDQVAAYADAINRDATNGGGTHAIWPMPDRESFWEHGRHSAGLDVPALWGVQFFASRFGATWWKNSGKRGQQRIAGAASTGLAVAGKLEFLLEAAIYRNRYRDQATRRTIDEAMRQFEKAVAAPGMICPLLVLIIGETAWRQMRVRRVLPAGAPPDAA